MKNKLIVIFIVAILCGVCFACFINKTSQNNISNDALKNEISTENEEILRNDIVIIKSGNIQNENLINEFINNIKDEEIELEIKSDEDIIKVKYIPKENNTENYVGDGSFESNKKIYGYYILTKNDETIGEYPLINYFIRKEIKDNNVILRFDSILVEYISEEDLPQICTYSVSSSNYKKSFELTYSQRKDMGIDEIYDNNEYKLKTFGGNVSITIEQDMVYFLVDALNQGVITSDDILQQAKIDAEYGICDTAYYKDGGSTEYLYKEYTILKLDRLDGDRDLIIGMRGPIINSYNKNK